MKRLLSCILSAALAFGPIAAPISAFAEQLPRSYATASAVDATFSDANLYSALIAQLNELGIAYTTDASKKDPSSFG